MLDEPVDNQDLFRGGATKDNLFPDTRKGCLDTDVLTSLGLTKAQIFEEDGRPDALFFFQLLLPLHDCRTKTVPNDPRKNFYQEVSIFSQIYASRDLQIMGTGYGSVQETATAVDFLRWDASIIMDGVLGGSDGAFYRRFDNRPGNLCHSEEILNAFTKERWHHLKRIYKLNDNIASQKKNQANYIPAYRYDFIYDTLVHNVNALTKKADDDQCVDETTFPFNVYGEPGAGLISLILNKPHVTKGAQLVLSCNVGRL